MEKKWTNIYLEKKNVDITGSCDLHIHSGPDCVERWGDTIDIARVAVEMGMRAIVFKDHFRPTTHKAILSGKFKGRTRQPVDKRPTIPQETE